MKINYFHVIDMSIFYLKNVSPMLLIYVEALYTDN